MPVVARHARHIQHAPRTAAASTEPRNLSDRLPLDGELQLHSAFGLSALGFLFLVVLAYLFRRQLRSFRLGLPARLVHALSVHRPVFGFVHIHLHTSDASYSPLHDHEHETNVTSPLTENANEEPAPPYSYAYSDRSFAKNPSKGFSRPTARNLHITVPSRQSLGPSSSSCSVSPGASTSTLTPSDAGSSNASTSPSSSPLISTPVSSQQQQQQNFYIEEEYKPRRNIEPREGEETCVLSLASPRAERWNGSYSYISHISSTTQSSNNTTTVPPISAARAREMMTTDSPCATPPPQYTITIHSSPRSQSYPRSGPGSSSTSESGESPPPVPDIILSPVPWLPREFAPPPSPPCYLSVPTRKSRSRQHRQEQRGHDAQEKKTREEKPLPYVPRTMPTKSAVSKSRVRHQFASPVQVTTPSNVPTSPVVEPSPPKPQQPQTNLKPTTSLPAGFEIRPPPRRSATLPIPRALPPPKPVLPIDLEAVYPTSPTSPTSDNTSFGSERDHKGPLPTSQAKGLTPWRQTAFQVAEEMKSYSEKRKNVGLGIRFGDSGPEGTSEDEEEDDVPLAKGLMFMKRKKRNTSETPVNQIRKHIFGRLSALAAKAKERIGKEFDSSDSEEEEETTRGEKSSSSSAWREERAVDTFVIGDEE